MQNSFGEYGSEGNIWILEGRSDKRMEKVV
jgi:hypothetical protein